MAIYKMIKIKSNKEGKIELPENVEVVQMMNYHATVDGCWNYEMFVKETMEDA